MTSNEIEFNKIESALGGLSESEKDLVRQLLAYGFSVEDVISKILDNRELPRERGG